MTIALDAAGEGEPLVLLHGVGTSREVWRHVLPGLAMTRRTIAVDLPGFGDSPPVGDRFDLDAVADAVADAAASRVRAAVESAVACDLRPMLAGVGAPLALLRGDRDRVVSAAAMRTLTETRPDALVATIHDCGHVPQLERPPAFLAAVERLLVGLGKS